MSIPDNAGLRLNIGEANLAKLFPAFLATDPELRLSMIGPSIGRQAKQIAIGDPLFKHFRWTVEESVAAIARLAATGEPVQMYGRCGSILLRGSIIGHDEGYFFAFGIVPAILSIDGSGLEVSDFSPSDPTMTAMMAVGLQKAMLEESRAIAIELARERQRSTDLLERMSRLSGYMAHDINNMISIIRLNGERLLTFPSLSPAQRRLVDIMRETAERGSSITRSLMTISHQKDFMRKVLPLDELVGGHRPFLMTICGAWIDLVIKTEAAGVMVDVNKAGLLNCLVNLLINARDAMPDGGRVTITTREIKSLRGGGVEIAVADNGPGMSPEVLERAFDPLFSTKAHGNGIGLASVREFARDMGGDCQLESALGVGTRARIVLPLAGHGPVAREPGRARDNPDGKSGRILVVEDEPYALEALTELLEADGYEVGAVATAADALTELQRRPYDVLLTDVILRGVGGLELAAVAGLESPDMAVVLMSGYVPDRREMRPDWLFIRKPLDTGELRRMLREAVASSIVS